MDERLVTKKQQLSSTLFGVPASGHQEENAAQAATVTYLEYLALNLTPYSIFLESRQS